VPPATRRRAAASPPQTRSSVTIRSTRSSMLSLSGQTPMRRTRQPVPMIRAPIASAHGLVADLPARATLQCSGGSMRSWVRAGRRSVKAPPAVNACGFRLFILAALGDSQHRRGAVRVRRPPGLCHLRKQCRGRHPPGDHPPPKEPVPTGIEGRAVLRPVKGRLPSGAAGPAAPVRTGGAYRLMPDAILVAGRSGCRRDSVQDVGRAEPAQSGLDRGAGRCWALRPCLRTRPHPCSAAAMRSTQSSMSSRSW